MLGKVPRGKGRRLRNNATHYGLEDVVGVEDVMANDHDRQLPRHLPPTSAERKVTPG